MSNPYEVGDIEPAVKTQMKNVAGVLDKILNDGLPAKTYGFALFTFKLGDTGLMNYISNARREDMICAVKEWLARAEGRHPMEMFIGSKQ